MKIVGARQKYSFKFYSDFEFSNHFSHMELLNEMKRNFSDDK